MKTLIAGFAGIAVSGIAAFFNGPATVTLWLYNHNLADNWTNVCYTVMALATGVAIVGLYLTIKKYGH